MVCFLQLFVLFFRQVDNGINPKDPELVWSNSFETHRQQTYRILGKFTCWMR
jgi:hypothetical protein